MTHRCSALLFRIVVVLSMSCCVLPNAYGLPSFARQTGQKCGACHVGGDWPQLTQWGRFFKLSGYTAGKSIVDKEGVFHLPVGVFGQAGMTWAAQPNDAQSNLVVDHNGTPQLYGFTGEFATKLTNFAGIFYTFEMGHEFPGWKGATGPADVRAVHFFHVGGKELLVGVDSNNSPTTQDVWNSVPTWTYPFYTSPQSLDGPASPLIANLEAQTGSIGAYALFDRQFYVEGSFYRAATGFYRWMSAGVDFHAGDQIYLAGENPYWRAYWTRSHGPHSVMAGTFGMRARVYPDSSNPIGPTDVFTDSGFDSQYQYLGKTHKVTLRGNYVYEDRAWDAGFLLGNAGTARGNIKSVNLSGSYSYDNTWTFQGGYLMTNGNRDSTLYAISDPQGNLVTSSPKTTGYTLEVMRMITQNIQVSAQYRGFTQFNGLRRNVDGMGRSASDNNTLWLNVFFAF